MTDRIKYARKIFDYLYVNDVPEKSDIIIGFGHFDLNIARRCASLFLDGYARKIVFTGGVGAGTADLDKPEAQAFLDVVLKEYPGIKRSDVLVEDKSSNTTENLFFTNELLQKDVPGMSLGEKAKTVMIVASPSRQRRVWLTCKKHFQGVNWNNVPPVSDYDNEVALFNTKNRDFVERLYGEVYRLMHYPSKGFIVKEPIPDDIMMAYNDLAC